MTADLLYLDSSALVKLVIQESESDAVLDLIRLWPVRVSSELAEIEVLRAACRVSESDAVRHKAEEVIAGLHLLPIDRQIVGRAARLAPSRLRSLDAIHLATALSLGQTLGAMAVYDLALGAAAADRGLKILTPGVERSV